MHKNHHTSEHEIDDQQNECMPQHTFLWSVGWHVGLNLNLPLVVF